MVIAFIVMSLIVLFWSRAVSAQYKKDFLFENPDTKERIKIETGNKVAIRFKIPDVMITGIILLLSDSSMNLVVDQVQQLVSFRNIASMKVIAQAKERYVVRLT